MEFYRAHRPTPATHERGLVVEAGQVMCPRRGIVDVEDCWICPAYRGLSGGRIERILCSTDPMLVPFSGRTPMA